MANTRPITQPGVRTRPMLRPTVGLPDTAEAIAAITGAEAYIESGMLTAAERDLSGTWNVAFTYVADTTAGLDAIKTTTDSPSAIQGAQLQPAGHDATVTAGNVIEIECWYYKADLLADSGLDFGASTATPDVGRGTFLYDMGTDSWSVIGLVNATGAIIEWTDQGSGWWKFRGQLTLTGTGTGDLRMVLNPRYDGTFTPNPLDVRMAYWQAYLIS